MPPHKPPHRPPHKPPPHPPWPHPQQCLPLEPSADEVLAEVRRIWQGRPYFRRRFSSFEALMACPTRQHLLLVCSRQALRARAARQR